MSVFRNDNNIDETKNESQPIENSYSYTYSADEHDTDGAKPKKKKRGFLKAVAFILCMAIVGTGSVKGYQYFEKHDSKLSIMVNDDKKSDKEQSESSDKSDETKASDESSTNSASSKKDSQLPSLIDLASRDDAKSVPDIVEEAMPSVVGIASTFEYKSNSNSAFSWGWGSSSTPESNEIKGTGTGIVMTADGYIITNAHVIYDDSEYQCGKAVDVSVVFSDKSELEAKIVGYDTESDIAVLKVDADNLTPATFGNSDELEVGELVIAIGNPLGFDLFGSVTSGIVSALNREISINEKQMKLIQTDAAINSGNSGGPLLNSCGQVIGINSAKMSSNYSSSASIEGLGFAIPISEAKNIIDDLISYGYVTGKPQIGISCVDVDELYSRYYNIPQGIWVREVEEGSAAEKAGIKVGDVIIGIEGEAVSSIKEMNEIKNKYKAGDEITLTISRSNEDIEIKLVLQEVTVNT
ncbi:MAG: trypsin-like peptidase domain-containing protein [Ruminococcus sp.]|nr:trypsin-like peptidase domain-containing protein [Ruminococcus sp.]MDD6634316.1 trypsin-like peptidase domain-containing protein [Ruminococcus sp.]MDY3214426.1 trypsin-like peptidase domain-containing protein [Ruminococcus sp.]MDY3844689.1 trypsin-like peptidase domain-containing protein [Ruminococcus sp.]